MTPKEILASNKFPAFVKQHTVFKKLKTIKKIFPEIGLPNCEKEVSIDNSEEITASANTLIGEVQTAIDKRLRNIKKWVGKQEKLSGKRTQKYEECIHLLEEMKQQMAAKSRKKFLVPNNGRFTLNIHSDILSPDKKTAFKSGEGLFRAYNKLNEHLREGKFVAMNKLDNMASFKDFSARNIPATAHKIVFSSDGIDGAWDIATMSMRGISSCQSWTTGNSTHLVGSIVDPFTGIIYLTNGNKFNEHGSKMIRRCVVRFVVDKKTQTPYLMLERMYPHDDKAVLTAFKEFLSERTDKKFEVIYYTDRGAGLASKYVPMSKAIEELDQYSQPYRDSAIVYETDPSDKRYVKEQIKRDMDSIVNDFAHYIDISMLSLKAADFSKDMRKAVASVRDVYSNYTRSYVATFLKKKIAAKSEAALIVWLGKNLPGLVMQSLMHLEDMLRYNAASTVAQRKLLVAKLIPFVEEKWKAYSKKELAKIERAKAKPVKTETIYSKLLGLE